MNCPYRSMSRESGCELVDDPSGISGVVAREFCDFRHCQECPLFQEALHENLKQYLKTGGEEELNDELADEEIQHTAPLSRFWKLALRQWPHVG